MSEITLEQTASHAEAPSPEKISNAKLAMWLYLASEVVIFGTLIAVYAVFVLNNPQDAREAKHALGIGLVGINTFVLLSSSWAMVMGLREAQKNNSRGLVRWISLTAFLGAAFVCLQGVEYTELGREGISLSTTFGTRFYAPTAFHGAHVIAGVLWALLVVRRARRGQYNSKNYLGVEIFGLYWHFVDVVWLFLFTIIYLI